MRYISLFSGIEAASVAWSSLGWEPVAFSEIDAFPSAVLAERFPNIPNLGDIITINWSGYASGAVGLVVGGSPCQSFSIAGKREGLKGASALMWEYVRAVRELRPSWLVWENVPGALSSEGGAAFGQLLSSMDDLGYGLAWRVLDAQFFGVPQRRRRVFLVGHFGDQRAAEVLFESESLSWDNPTSQQKRQTLAREPYAPAGRSVYCAADSGAHSAIGHDIAPTLTAHEAKSASYVMTPATLQTQTLFPGDGSIRRLTPVECERLQGFPDGWTDIPYKGKEHAPDSSRYKALGNSMAVPVMRWIGRRINQQEF